MTNHSPEGYLRKNLRSLVLSFRERAKVCTAHRDRDSAFIWNCAADDIEAELRKRKEKSSVQQARID